VFKRKAKDKDKLKREGILKMTFEEYIKTTFCDNQITVQELIGREHMRLGWEACQLYNKQPETLQYTRDELVDIIRKAYNRSAGFTFQACARDVVDALEKAKAFGVRDDL
jgi:hypothetical protein